MTRGRPKKNVKGVAEEVDVPSEAPQSEKRKTFVYFVPETKEDYLALIQCLKDTGANSIGTLEVNASRL